MNEVKNWLTAVGLILSGIGLCMNAWQLHKARRQQRAQYLISTFTAYMQDPDLRDVFYKLQYGTFSYPEGFKNDDIEGKTDRLLNHFTRVVTLCDLGVVSKSDLRCLTHEFWVIARNGPLQAYFGYLDDLYEKKLISKYATFASLRSVARQIANEA